jgi:hypothetical protein
MLIGFFMALPAENLESRLKGTYFKGKRQWSTSDKVSTESDMSQKETRHYKTHSCSYIMQNGALIFMFLPIFPPHSG